MRKTLLVLFAFTFFETIIAQEKNTLRLWYRQPAANWLEALPVGNGRMGAMVFGDPQHETIQINEESLWAGNAINDNNPSSFSSLRAIQQLLLENKNEEAYTLATKNMVAIPRSVRSYQTFMNLKIDFGDGNVKAYNRELDLIRGIATASYSVNGSSINQEVFCSSVDNLLVVRIHTTTPGGINCTLSLDRRQDASVKVKNNVMILSGQISDTADDRRGPGGLHMKFAGAALVNNVGGRVNTADNMLSVIRANEVVIYINAVTNYDAASMNLDASKQVEHACMKPLLHTLNYINIWKNHIADHSKKMKTVSLVLEEGAFDTLPTDERIRGIKNGRMDQGLMVVYFQYGRYLLLGSSRKPGILPANLQGIWCKDYEAPWQSDFHTNINLQMNYWPAEATGLPETVDPLILFLERIRKNGRVTASAMYGAKGWAMHHNTSAFGQTGLHDAIEYGTYPLAGAWMCLHLWEHYLYTQDKKFLAEKAFPIMQESAQFILDFLIKDKNGYLVTAPSYSPENSFLHPVTGIATQITYASTMDIQIIHELFNSCIAASNILKKEKNFTDKLKQTLSQLPPVRINSFGGIQEWIEDYKEAEPGHRHISQLFGLHPGTQINEQTPELFAAARKTIEHRLANGGGHTGWSRAWIINFFARLKDGDKALENIQALLAKSTLPNLFDDHPPFQIDGNFGGCAGMAEMLMQSQNGYIELLPALPTAWKNGAVKGLRARGGFIVDISWKDGKLSSTTFTSLAGQPLEFVYQGKHDKHLLKEGASFTFQAGK